MLEPALDRLLAIVAVLDARWYWDNRPNRMSQGEFTPGGFIVGAYDLPDGQRTECLAATRDQAALAVVRTLWPAELEDGVLELECAHAAEWETQP